MATGRAGAVPTLEDEKRLDAIAALLAFATSKLPAEHRGTIPIAPVSKVRVRGQNRHHAGVIQQVAWRGSSLEIAPEAAALMDRCHETFEAWSRSGCGTIRNP